MSTLTAFGKLPTLNSATILLVGTNEVFQHQLAETILMEKQNLKVNIHLTASLPLPAERDHIRPRIDLIVFMINMQSKHSFTNIEASLKHVDANFFLGKVCFLATGAGRMNQISVEVNAILNLADLYCSPILFCELEVVTQAVDGGLVVDLIFQSSSTGIKGSDLRFATPDQMMLQQQPDPISKPYDSYMHC